MKKLQYILLGLCSLPVFAGEGAITYINLLTHDFPKEHIYTFIFIAGLLTILGLFYKRSIAGKSEEVLVAPDPGVSLRNILEVAGEGVYSILESTVGKDKSKDYFPLACYLFIFIFLSNAIGLIPGFLPPTDNLNTTLALGLFTFVMYHKEGVKVHGLMGWVKHFMGPIPLLAIIILPLEIISHCVRPLSLALRLRGNIMGDHLVLSVFSDIVPWIAPIPFLGLGLFVSFMQAFVFTILSLVYVSLAIEHHDHDEHH